MVIAAVMAICISFFIAAKSTLNRREAASVQQTQLHAADAAACARINKLYHLIQVQVRLSLTTTPKLDYYKQHPDELKAVQQRARDEIKAFAPEKCKEVVWSTHDTTRTPPQP